MKKQFKVTVLIVTFVAALTLVLLIRGTITSVKKKTEAACFSQLNEATHRLADDLYKTTDMDQAYLMTMASLLARESDASDESLCAILNSYDSETSYLNYLEILRPDQTMLDSDGTIRDLSESLSFAEEAEKGMYISSIERSTKDPTHRIIRNAVPVKQDGNTIAMLYGVVDLELFKNAYKTNIYGGDAYVYLIDGDTGDFFLDTWHKTFGNMRDFEDRKSIAGDSFEEAKEKMKQGKDGDLAFVSQSSGDTLYMHYEPVGIRNWCVAVTVQDRYALRTSNEINQDLFRMAALCGLVVFVYMSFVTASLLSANRRIHKLGMWDTVTGLQNRNAYDEFLNHTQNKKYELVSCVFIDVNGLHELNNRKGHDAGDELLRCVAEVLSSAFPTGNVYRTGGDEFVAIVEKMEEATCTEKTIWMSKQLNEKGYWIACGVASGENRIGLSELITLADERMIANKKKYYAQSNRHMR